MKSVAVIGASADRSKFGNKAVRAYQAQGYAVFPIHPTLAEVEGLRAYPRVTDVPEAVDMVSLYVPPEVGLEVIEDVAQRGVAEVWLNPGSESPELVARAKTLGLDPIIACSIIGIGDSPHRY